MIDLHSHTTASDGEHAPEKLVRLAREAGVTTLAVTDHDTVAALSAAAEAGRTQGVRIVPGIELSAYVGDREVHVLGHFIDACFAPLVGLSALLRAKRRERMEKMLRKLRTLGIAVEMAEVEARSSGDNLGRPHLAQVLMKHGVADSVDDAFKRFLSRGAAAYVDRYRLSAREAIDLAREAGGVATLAHPGVSKVLPAQVAELKRFGLAGIEVFHSDQDESERTAWLEVARRLELVPTAGSDFHGARVAPRRHLGAVGMDPEELARLEARRGPRS